MRIIRKIIDSALLVRGMCVEMFWYKLYFAISNIVNKVVFVNRQESYLYLTKY